MLTTWTSVALWLLPATLVGLVILAGALWSLRRQRGCPSCQTPMRVLTRPQNEGATPSYEVMVCDTCTNAATLVHGHTARFAYCPSCLNRALRTPCIRQADGSVKIEEHCELCGFKAQRIAAEVPPLADAAPVMGQVIPFPTHRVRPGRRADEA